MTPQGSKHVVVILTYIIIVVLTEISMLLIINLTLDYSLQQPLFYSPLVLHLLCFNAPCQYISLLNLRPLIFGLGYGVAQLVQTLRYKSRVRFPMESKT